MIDDHVLVADLVGKGMAGRAFLLSTLRVRLALARRRVGRTEALRAVAVYPGVAAASVSYELDGAVRRYAETHLLPGQSGVPRVLVKMITAMAGCSPAIGAMVLAGRSGVVADVQAITASLQPPGARARLSVAEIHTTRRLFLVFAERDDRPEWVLQFGSFDELATFDGLLTRLYGLLPDLVSHPVALQRWRDDIWAHVQQGLPGLPWFRLRDAITGLGAWLALRDRAADALVRFQTAVGRTAEWSAETTPGEALRALSDWYRTVSGADERVLDRVNRATVVLDRWGAIRGAWQHGDYCFNNLLVSPERLGLIDFEEFGRTSMPLHDEFSLAFSTHDLIRGIPGSPALGDILKMGVEPTCRRAGLDSEVLEGLLFHHLLWRLSQCAGRERRRAVAVELRRHLSRLAEEPKAYGLRPSVNSLGPGATAGDARHEPGSHEPIP